MRMLDLFSGLGGAHKSMIEEGWDVITVDIDQTFNPTYCCDIKNFTYPGPYPVNLLWASPPCTEFSKSSMPWHKDKANPNTDLLRETMRIIYEVNPDWWIIENVRGSLPYFYPILGIHRKKIGSRYLWGKFPIFDCDPAYGKWRIPPGPDRSALRSKIPSQISKAICGMCEMIK